MYTQGISTSGFILLFLKQQMFVCKAQYVIRFFVSYCQVGGYVFKMVFVQEKPKVLVYT